MSDEVWHRVVQVVTGFGENTSEGVQQYAANKAFIALSSASVHENMVKLGAYLLSEFGSGISASPGKDPQAQYEVIHKHFVLCSDATKCQVLSAYMKMCNAYPELMDYILPVFEHHKYSWDPDLQQRAAEYESLCSLGEIMAVIMEPMPTYPDELQENNILLNRINQMSTDVREKPDAKKRDVQDAPPAEPVIVQQPVVAETSAPAASVDLLNF